MTEPPAVTAADELPLPTYPAASGELAAWTLLQKARIGCGFNPLEQNTKLDTASRAHGQYLLAEGGNGSFATGHAETNGNNPYYTGHFATDRAVYAGYGPYVTELLAASTETYVPAPPASAPTAAARGERDMQSLLNSVAHLSGAMSGSRLAGLATVTVSNQITTPRGTPKFIVNHRLGILLGNQESQQSLGAGQVAGYPCAGSTDIAYTFAPATEEPNPFPEITDKSVQVGPPIYLRADVGSDLRVTTFTLKNASGVDQPVRSDAVPRQGHEFFMVPKSPLAPATRYTVRLEGTANGAAFVRSFEFRTRS